MRSRTVQRKEIAWFAVVALLILALSSLPYLVGHLSEPDGLKFAGVLIAPDDNLSYLAKMELGRRGGWLFYLPYTAQTHTGVPLIYSYYIFLGHLVRWLQLSTITVFHLARLFNGFILLGIVYLVIVQVSDTLTERRMLFTLVGLSSGFGWLALPLGLYLSTDLTVPEANTFLTLFANAHYPLSEALMSLAFLMLATFAPVSRWCSGVYISAISLLTLISPFALVTVMGVAAVYILVRWREQGRPPVVLIKPTMVAAAISLPLFGLIWYFLNADPLLRIWHKAQMMSPAIGYYISGYGLILVGAIMGGRILLKRKRPIDQVLLIWVGVTLLLLYFPVSLQRRFSMGLHIPLAILAGVGLHRRVAMVRKEARRWLITRAIMVLIVATNFVIVLLYSSGALLHVPQLYLTKDEEAALAWLRQNGEMGTVILSSTELGRFVPVFSAGRAVSGHGFETVNAEVAELDVIEFYDDATTPERRAAILDQYNVAYVIFGPREEALNASARDAITWLTMITRVGSVEIYAADTMPY